MSKCVHGLQDWVDIDFAISEGVDAIAVSFVKSPEVIKHLKSYVAARSPERYCINLIFGFFYVLMCRDYNCLCGKNKPTF